MASLGLLFFGLLLNTPIWAQCVQRADYGVGTSPKSVAVGDVNGDGRLDIITANQSSNNVTILLQQSTGDYSRTDYIVDDGPVSVTVGYVNADTQLDIVTANGISNTVTVLLQQSGGNYTRADFAVGNTPSSVALGRLDTDARLDIVTANAGDNTVTVLIQRAGSAGYTRTNYAVGVQPLAIAVADMNEDDRLDILTANNGDDTVTMLLKLASTGYSTTSYSVGAGPASIAVGDLDGFDPLDIVTVSPPNSRVSEFRRRGTGGSTGVFPVANAPAAVALGDMNGNGRYDIVTANQSNNVTVFLGSLLLSPTVYPVGDGPVAIALGDMNGDGRPDVVTANQTSNSVTVVIDQAPTFILQNNTVCRNQQIDLTTFSTVSPIGGTLSFYTTLADAQAGTNSLPSATVQPIATTIYYLRYVINGSCIGTSSLTLTIDEPTVSVTNNGPLTCTSANAILTASSSTTAVGSYHFAGPGLTQTGSANTATVSQPGTYTVTLTTTGACPVSLTSSTTVEQNTTPPTIMASNDGPLNCTTRPRVTVNTPASADVRYLWTGPQQKGNINASFFTTVPGQFKLLATAPNGCTATGTTTVEGSLDAPVTRPPTLANNGPLSCSMTSVTMTLTASIDESLAPISYNFFGPGGPIPSNGITAITREPGTYSAVITGTNGCSIGATTTVTSNISLTSSTGNLCEGQTAILTASGGSSYVWNTGQTTASISVSLSGTYSVTVSGTDGCSATAQTTIGTCMAADLSPMLYTLPSTLYGTSNFSVVVDVFGVNSFPSSGLITVYIAKDPQMNLNLNRALTLVGGKVVKNGLWTFDGVSAENFYVLTTSQVIGGGSKRSFGLTGVLSPGNTKGGLTISAIIVGNSGSEVRITNNADADKLDYFNR